MQMSNMPEIDAVSRERVACARGFRTVNKPCATVVQPSAILVASNSYK
jgi:hypothetical protein